MIKTWFNKIKEFAMRLLERLKTFWLTVAEPWLHALTVKKVIGLLFIGGVLAILFVVLLFFVLSINLPTVESLKDYKPLPGTLILAEDGRVLGQIKIEKGTYVPLNRVPQFMKNAILATEDPRFFQHKGLDYRGILRAAFKDIIAIRLAPGGRP